MFGNEHIHKDWTQPRHSIISFIRFPQAINTNTKYTHCYMLYVGVGLGVFSFVLYSYFCHTVILHTSFFTFHIGSHPKTSCCHF